MQYVAGAQRPSAVAAKLTEGKGAFTAQVVRHLNAAAQAEIASDAWPAYRPQPEGRPRRNREDAVHLLVDAVERYGQRRAAVLNFSVGPLRVISSAASPSALPSRRLPRRSARSSIGPEGGTPTAQNPRRPG